MKIDSQDLIQVNYRKPLTIINLKEIIQIKFLKMQIQMLIYSRKKLHQQKLHLEFQQKTKRNLKIRN